MMIAEALRATSFFSTEGALGGAVRSSLQVSAWTASYNNILKQTEYGIHIRNVLGISQRSYSMYSRMAARKVQLECHCGLPSLKPHMYGVWGPNSILLAL